VEKASCFLAVYNTFLIVLIILTIKFGGLLEFYTIFLLLSDYSSPPRGADGIKNPLLTISSQPPGEVVYYTDVLGSNVNDTIVRGAMINNTDVLGSDVNNTGVRGPMINNTDVLGSDVNNTGVRGPMINNTDV
jgi:hypothetical protein